MTSMALAFDVLARDKGAKKTFREIGDEGTRSGQKIAKAFSGLGEKLKVGLAGAGALAGAGLVAGLTGAIQRGADSAKLSAQLGLNPADSAKAAKLAGAIYSNNFGDSISGVNDAIRRVVNDIGVNINSVNLRPITEQALTLADTFDQDVGGVTRSVGQLLRTGLATNAKDALDIIARGFQSGADKSEDFLDTLNEYGTQFRKLGINGITATGLISQGLKAGARDGDIVADAFKEFSIRAIDGSATTKQGFDLLGLSADKLSKSIAKGGPAAKKGLDTVLDRLRAIKDPTKQAQAATALFGTQAEDLGQALFKLDLDSATKGMGNLKDAAQRVGDTVGNTAASKIETFKRKLQTGLVDFVGNKVLPKISEFTEAFRNGFVYRTQEQSGSAAGVVETLGRVLAEKIVPAVKDFVQGMKDGTGPGGTFASTVGDIANAAQGVAEFLLPVVQFLADHPDLFKSVAVGAGVLATAFKFQALYGAAVARFMPGLAVATAAEGAAAGEAAVGVAALSGSFRAAAASAAVLLPALVNIKDDLAGIQDFVKNSPVIQKYFHIDPLRQEAGPNTSTYVPGAGHIQDTSDSRRSPATSSGGLTIHGGITIQPHQSETSGDAFVRKLTNLTYTMGL